MLRFRPGVRDGAFILTQCVCVCVFVSLCEFVRVCAVKEAKRLINGFHLGQKNSLPTPALSSPLSREKSVYICVFTVCALCVHACVRACVSVCVHGFRSGFIFAILFFFGSTKDRHCLEA